MWGVIPAAGNGTRIQPLAFSKELLPVGGRAEAPTERPKAVSEYLVDRMVIGGSGYPQDFPWTDNIFFVKHLPPSDHPAFFSSSRLTLNVTRADMAAMGYCPSGRLFEAAACGAAVLSDWWEGLDAFFEPGREIVIARGTAGALDALDIDESRRKAMAAAARERVLQEHTSAHRARELVELVRDPGLGARLAASQSESAKATGA